MPYHPGAIRYFDEVGTWTEEAQAHNEELIARQAVLNAAWEQLKTEEPQNWDEAWTQKRREALDAAGLKVAF